MQNSHRKIIFLDRDDTINKDFGYISKPEQIELLPFVIEGLSLLKTLNFEFIILTNQSGIGRKYFTEEDLKSVNERLKNILKKHSIFILDIFYCPHTDEDQCNCRKPKPGLLLNALEKYKNIDLSNSWIIGDRIRDILPGENFGLKGIIIHNEIQQKEAMIPKNLVSISENLLQAAIFIRNYELQFLKAIK